MSDFQQHPSASSGIDVDDLPLINRALFDHAVPAATDLHDPSSDTDNFLEALWTHLARIRVQPPALATRDPTTGPFPA